MQFLLAIFADDAVGVDPEFGLTCRAYEEALRAAGVFVEGRRLQPASSAATLRVRDGRRSVDDGPVSPAPAPLRGYIVVEVPSLHDALEWAARCPAASRGVIEVRPILTRPQ